MCTDGQQYFFLHFVKQAYKTTLMTTYKNKVYSPGLPEILHLKATAWPSLITCPLSGSTTLGACSVPGVVGLEGCALPGVDEGCCTKH
jgi:hypothetical protein